jgi:hypothetical protein
LPNGVPEADFVLGLAGDAGDDGEGGVVIESEVASSPSALLPSLPVALDARFRPRELRGFRGKYR